MAGTPTKERRLEPFLDQVAREIPQSMDLDAENSARAVFEVMSDRVDYGEVAKVVRTVALEIRDLWPLLAQLDAAQDRL